MVKYVKASSNSFSIEELANIILEIWKKHIDIHSTIEYIEYIKNKYGIDVTGKEIDEAWDLAASGFPQDDEDDDDGWTEEEARNWLKSKLEEYGNTYWFPQEDKITLDRLCEKFGNTYFWR